MVISVEMMYKNPLICDDKCEWLIFANSLKWCYLQ